jgi:membrane associated rhomboid family serine protease
VLLAVGLPHEVVRVEGGAALVVPGWVAPRALAELARWQAENAPQAPETPPGRRSSGRDGALAFALALVSAHLARASSARGLAWFEAGVLDAGRVAHGELQRTLTALLLHLDPPHLLANVGFGALFVGTLCWRLGTGAGLLATLLAGGCGNLAAALLRPAGRAAGASTAVFAALGLLAVLGLRPRGPLLSGRLRRWSPLLAALALFGYLGAEGERVDVLGHAAGFGAGLLLGAVLVAAGAVRAGSVLGRALDRSAGQWACGVLAGGLAAAAWAVALA